MDFLRGRSSVERCKKFRQKTYGLTSTRRMKFQRKLDVKGFTSLIREVHCKLLIYNINEVLEENFHFKTNAL